MKKYTLESARAELEGTARELDGARKELAKAERAVEVADPSDLLAARKKVRALQDEVSDLEALVQSWRGKISELEKAEKLRRLETLRATPCPRDEIITEAAALVPLVKELRERLDGVQAKVASFNVAAAEAAVIAKELKEPVGMTPLPPGQMNAALAVALYLGASPGLQIAAPQTAKQRLGYVLVQCGMVDAHDAFGLEFLRGEAKTAGMTQDEVVAYALDGTLMTRIRTHRAEREAQEAQRRAERLAAKEHYEEIAKTFPWSDLRAATPEQIKMLEAAEVAHFGEGTACKLREARGHQDHDVTLIGEKRQRIAS